MTFKEYYLHQEASAGSYFPTFTKAAKAVAAAPGAVARSFRPGTSKTDFPTFSKAGRAAKAVGKPIARGLSKIGKGLKAMGEPDYQRTFKPSANLPGQGLFQRHKTMKEVKDFTREWRTSNIIKGGHLDDKIQQQLMADKTINKYPQRESEYLRQRGKAGVMPAIDPHIVLKDSGERDPAHPGRRRGEFGGIVDGNFKSSQNEFKNFTEPSHYANQILDQMQTYIDKGYAGDELKTFTRGSFDPYFFDIIWNGFNFDSYK